MDLMHPRRRLIATFALLLLLGCQGKPQGGDKLPAFGVARDGITVSGISSGGYMAGQFHLAHSSAISGLGIIAAGPYGCAQNSMTTALGPCVKGGVDVPALLEAARTAAMRGAIDPLESTRGDRIWLFHGSADEVVNAGVMTAARDFYTSLTDPANVSYVDNVAVTHGLPTRSTGAPCKQFGRPYLNACDYDAAGEMLKALRGDLAPPVEARGRLIAFDQAEFGDASLNATGYVYVPTACAAGGACSLHIFFHGCDQSAELVADAVARGAGFNEWAEANRLIVLYPQAKSSRMAPLNPLGCWDWWGYTDEDYATRDGAQIKAVQAMIERLTTPRGGT
jgi:poly(3-hydroxybutyrate) depolymerase